AVPRRPARRRLRPRLHDPADDAGRPAGAGPDRRHAGAPGGARGARAIDRGAPPVTYVRPPDRAGALRLHLNENTGGCSPAVLEAIARITPEQVAVYPDYADLLRDCAGYLGVAEDRLVLTNGLDEGLLAATVSAFRVMQT